jgi:hypothetical protein
MSSQGMWEMLSELLEGEKLPESLNQNLYDLRDGKAFVVRELTDEEILEVFDGLHAKFEQGFSCLQFARAILKKASEK